jgi:hypothetical protein
MSIVSHMPKWRPMKASTPAVRTGPVKNGQNSRNGREPRARTWRTVITVSKSGEVEQVTADWRRDLVQA